MSSQAERPMLAVARRAAIADLLHDAGAVTVTEVETRFGVSPMTARRDLAELERRGIARRTHGGAVLPAIAAHEDSFGQRVEVATAAKTALADAAVAMIAPRESIFLDSSSTTYFVAKRIVELGLGVTVITNSLPVMDVIATAESPNVHLIGVGGTLRPLTRSYVGPAAVTQIRGHFADRVFLSVKGVTRDGVLVDADELEAEVKRSMVAQSQSGTLLLDESKLGARGRCAIGPITDLAGVIAHGAPAAALVPLRATGVAVEVLA